VVVEVVISIGVLTLDEDVEVEVVISIGVLRLEEDVVVEVVLSVGVLTLEEDVVVEVVLSVGVLSVPEEDVVVEVVLSVGVLEEGVVPELGVENEVEKIVKISDSVTVLVAPIIVDSVVIVAVGIRHPSVLS